MRPSGTTVQAIIGGLFIFVLFVGMFAIVVYLGGGTTLLFMGLSLGVILGFIWSLEAIFRWLERRR